MDRIDIHVEVPRLAYQKINSKTDQESSASIRERIEKGREIQRERFKEDKTVSCNAEMRPAEIKKYCQLDSESDQLMHIAMDRYQLSARAFHRLLKLARTIADLDTSPDIQSNHIAEAIQYRPRQME